jgi:hypothetical protein
MLARLRAALIRLAVLVVMVFVGDRTLAWELGRVLLQSQARYSVIYHGGPPADVVAVGNSRGQWLLRARAGEGARDEGAEPS